MTLLKLLAEPGHGNLEKIKVNHALLAIGPKLAIPEKFVFCINDSCSFRCKMCYNWTNKHNPRLDYYDWIRFLDEIYIYKKRDIEINVIGGEPLEIPWAVNLISYAKRLGFIVSLSTNAYFIREDNVKKIIDSRLDNISISLDGFYPSTHDNLRGVKGAYQRVMEAMNYLRKYPKGIRPRIVIQTLVNGINLEELEDLAKFVSNDYLVDDGIYFMVIMKPNSPKIGDNWREHDKFGLWPKDINKALKKINLLQKMKTKGYKILNSQDQLMAFYNYFKAPDSFTKKEVCNVSDFGGFIESTGNVYICREFKEIGNIKERNIVRVFNSERSAVIRRKMGKCKKNCNFLINCFYQDEIENNQSKVK